MSARLVRNLVPAVVVLLTAVPLWASEHEAYPEPFSVQGSSADSIRYVAEVTEKDIRVNLLGMTLTNYGFIGNNFISRSASVEYPLGTGYEHMVRGGLWIGAKAIDNFGPFVGVTTGALDGSQGSASQSATEYTPAGNDIAIRSTLGNNRYFNHQAVSELDFISEYSDRPAKRADNNRESHRPLNILVHQENYAWGFSDYQHFSIFHFTIKNIGDFPLDSVWVALYSELASGPKNLYGTWPPSSAASTVGSWFSKKLIAYDDSLRLFREHYCNGLPVPSGCVLDRVPAWFGMRLLGWKPGHPDTITRKVTLSLWSYAPGSLLRDEDTERYRLLNTGKAQPIVGDSLQPQTGDPVELFGVGPFPELDPGESLTVDFALVGGTEIKDIQRHSSFAQRAYDRNYIVPIPPPSPRLHVVARDRALDLYWDRSPEDAVDITTSILKDFEGYRVYISDDGQTFNRVAQFDLNAPPHDTTGFNTGLGAIMLASPATFDGRDYQYKYSIPALRDGFKYYVAVTSYDLGNVEIESLESGKVQNTTLAIPSPAADEKVKGGEITVFPNPYRVEARWDTGKRVRDHYLWFANLPTQCTLRIYTLSGDQIYSTAFNGDNYRGQNARGVYDPSRDLPPTLSGSSFAWNLITDSSEAIATGLYIYSVEDAATHQRTVGKFLVVKSDREN